MRVNSSTWKVKTGVQNEEFTVILGYQPSSRQAWVTCNSVLKETEEQAGELCEQVGAGLAEDPGSPQAALSSM